MKPSNLEIIYNCVKKEVSKLKTRKGEPCHGVQLTPNPGKVRLSEAEYNAESSNRKIVLADLPSFFYTRAEDEIYNSEDAVMTANLAKKAIETLMNSFKRVILELQQAMKVLEESNIKEFCNFLKKGIDLSYSRYLDDFGLRIDYFLANLSVNGSVGSRTPIILKESRQNI